MAPRKRTDEKVTSKKSDEKGSAKQSANEAADTVLHYIRKVNRPYSANDISANLHNKVTKAAAAKILKDLHERNEIEGRAAGKSRKQIVYHAIQNPEDSCTPEQLAALDTAINDLHAQTTNLQATAKTLRSTLSALNSTLSTANLIADVQALESEQAEIVARLGSLKAGKAKKVTKKERDEVENEWKKWSRIAKTREKVAMEMWSMIEETLPDAEKKAEIRESLGLDD